jgi:uncharacterized protein (TIGR02996 family)
MAKRSWWRRLLGGAAAPVEEPRAPTARDASLEAEIARDPEAIDPYLVYADWLQQHGDPRGELISLQAKATPETDAAAAAMIERWPERFGGALEERDRVEWHCGYWRRLHFAPGPDSDASYFRLARVLGHDSARFLRALAISTNYGQPIAKLVPAELPPTVRSLHLGDFIFPDESELTWTTVGDATAVYRTVPQLERFALQGAEIILGDRIELRRLRALELVTAGLPGETARAIVRSELPELDTLIVWTGDDTGGGSTTAADLLGLFASPRPQLRHFGLVNCAITDELVLALVEAPWLPQLRVLDLSKGTLTADGIAILERARDRLGDLERLEVSENLLDDDACARAAALARTVNVADQRFGDLDEGARYPAVTE